ncbi:MAG: DUF11 domain-containing protein, partial [Thermoplasmata archaeon]|nr:DUF11 domain-containing protein [Thermoplasmata archaeon]
NIDGEFADWDDIAKAQLQPSAEPNPNINIIQAAVEDNGAYLAFFIEVEGAILSGMPPPDSYVDTFQIYIDSDQDRDTGYRLENIGADHMVFVYGWQGRVYSSHLYSFDVNNDPNDWSGWTKGARILSGVNGNQLETQVSWPALGLDERSDVDVYFYAQDYSGQEKMADFSISNQGGFLLVGQTSLLQEMVPKQLSFNALRLDMRALNEDATINNIVLTVKGTASTSDLYSVNLYTAQGTAIISNRLVTPSGFTIVPNQPIVVEKDTSETLFVSIEVHALATPGKSIGITIAEPNHIDVDAAKVELKSTPPSGGYVERAYIMSPPDNITIDGAFADWRNVADNINYDNDTHYLNIRDYRVDAEATTMSFYLEVDGRMLGGTRIPYRNRAKAEPAPPPIVADSDRDTVPDQNDMYPYDFDNDGILDIDTDNDRDGDGIKDYPYGADWTLETVIPDYYDDPYAGKLVGRYIGPVIMPPLIGEDTVYAYVDKDKNPDTGYKVNNIGADHLISISGKYGEVLSTGYFKYNETADTTDWTEEGNDVLVETDYSRLEVQLDPAKIGLQDGDEFDMVLGTAKWHESGALPSTKSSLKESTKSPAGDNVVLNEISSMGSPEWIELANPTNSPIDISGWTIQERPISGGTWMVIYTFPGGSTIDAWGSGGEYLTVDLGPDVLRDNGARIRLVDDTDAVVDLTKFPNLVAGETLARYKDGSDGKPLDTDQDSKDWYISVLPSKGGPNDRHRPIITVEKSADKSETSPGETITYTVLYNNIDEGVAKYVWINDTLPDNVTYQSSSETYDSFTGQTYRWIFTNVTPGDHSYTIAVRVNNDTPDETSLVNNVTLDYTDQLNRSMETSSDNVTTISRRPIITVEKIVDKDTAVAGEQITYTVYYNNTGTGSAADVWVNDTLPEGVTYIGAAPAPDSIDGQILRWHFTDVGPGIHSLTIDVTVNLTVPDPVLTNLACSNCTTDGGVQLEESCDTVVTVVPEFVDVMIPIFGVLLVFFVVKRRKRIGGR